MSVFPYMWKNPFKLSEKIYKRCRVGFYYNIAVVVELVTRVKSEASDGSEGSDES